MRAGPTGSRCLCRRHLPTPRVAMMWVPQSFGSPNIAGNQPADYWPGGKYVDWVGFDLYAKFRTAFGRDKAFFDQYKRKPFVIGEYGPWDNDQSGAFTGELVRWAEAHDRVKMLIYYRGVDPDNIFNLQFYPGARRALRNHLDRAPLARVRAGVKGSATRRRPSRSRIDPPEARPVPRRGSG